MRKASIVFEESLTRRRAPKTPTAAPAVATAEAAASGGGAAARRCAAAARGASAAATASGRAAAAAAAAAAAPTGPSPAAEAAAPAADVRVGALEARPARLADEVDAHVAAVNLAVIEVARRRLGAVVAGELNVRVPHARQASRPINRELDRGHRAEQLEDFAQVGDGDVECQV